VSSARRLLRASVRRTEGRFLVEGPQGVTAAAAAGSLLEVFATADAAARLDLDVAITVVGDRALASLAETIAPQGVVGVAATVDRPLADVLSGSPRLVVVLLDIRDPGNAGAVIRTADAAGADAVVLAVGDEGGAVDVHNGKAVRASAGSVFHLPITTGPWTGVLSALRASRLRVLATAAEGTLDLFAADLDGPTAWVLGNEAHGLPSGVVGTCDAAVAIPIRGRAESLNVAAAAAICLYASARAQAGAS
jgi:TrmH family RNA methyltransferase